MALFTKEEALSYHSTWRTGKLEVVPIKPCRNQKDLSLAYSPGVAQACLAIKDDPEMVWKYTNRRNLVAVVSNGTAVLGLGNIGPKAGKPVMEGKGVLFKIFADIDVYDINLDTKDPAKVIETVKLLEPTFGAINLEDIKAPECFEIEQKLIEIMDIPVFHDDQHGTAIISGAGILNAAEIAGKKIGDLKIVVSGAGAAAIACSKFYIALGVDPANIAMFDSKGHINTGRADLHPTKQPSSPRKRPCPAWVRPSRTPTSSWACPRRAWCPRIWSRAWAKIPSSSPWPTPIPRSPTTTPRPPGPTPSWAPAVRTSPTRSTTSRDSRSSSGAPWMSARKRSTRR